MKTEFLTELGLDQATIDKIMAENGKDINGLKSESEKLKSVADNHKTQLDAANSTIADMTAKMEEMQKLGADAEGLKKQLDEALAAAAQSKIDAENAQREASERVAAIEYDSAVKEYTSGINFSSEAAKRAFMFDLKAKEFKLENGKLEGADDFRAEVEKTDPSAFAKADAGIKGVKPMENLGSSATGQSSKDPFVAGFDGI